jgi:hypothetical protein
MAAFEVVAERGDGGHVHNDEEDVGGGVGGVGGSERQVSMAYKLTAKGLKIVRQRLVSLSCGKFLFLVSDDDVRLEEAAAGRDGIFAVNDDDTGEGRDDDRGNGNDRHNFRSHD